MNRMLPLIAVRSLPCALGFFAFAASAGLAHASWTVTSLHPTPGEGSSAANGSWGMQQVGYAASGPVGSDLGGHYSPLACLWNSSAASFVSLHPVSAQSSQAYGIDGGQQIGAASFEEPNPGFERPYHAGTWNGTAASWVDMHPTGAIRSKAFAGSNGHQVGYAEVTEDQPHASLWHGTAASWTDLNPASASMSTATDIENGQQVGSASFNGKTHAGRWSGTAASWVDLHPAGAVESWATATHNGQQVGTARMATGYLHAALWNGSAESWVDLAPTTGKGANSQLLDVWNNWQVGVRDGGQFGLGRASIWNGTADSWEDLSLSLSSLPGFWIDSIATGIWSDGTTLFVTGSAFNLDTNQEEALLWSRPIPAPSTTILIGCGAIVALRRRR